MTSSVIVSQRSYNVRLGCRNWLISLTFHGITHVKFVNSDWLVLVHLFTRIVCPVVVDITLAHT